jgi:hypothetical protein
MDSVPGSAHDSDAIFTNPMSFLYMPFLAGTSTHTSWPPVDPTPGHLTPGLSFTAYQTRSRPYEAEVCGAFETGDNCDVNQPFHDDQTMQGEQLEFRRETKYVVSPRTQAHGTCTLMIADFRLI